MMIDLKALLPEGVDGLHRDVFKQEEPDVVLVDGPKDLGLADGISDGLCTDAFSKGGVSGGDGECSHCGDGGARDGDLGSVEGGVLAFWDVNWLSHGYY